MCSIHLAGRTPPGGGGSFATAMRQLPTCSWLLRPDGDGFRVEGFRVGGEARTYPLAGSTAPFLVFSFTAAIAHPLRGEEGGDFSSLGVQPEKQTDECRVDDLERLCGWMPSRATTKRNDEDVA